LHKRKRRQPFVPGGPRKSVVWWGKAECGVGWTLLGGAGVLEGCVLVSGGFGGGSTLVVMIADEVLGGTLEGACVVVGELVRVVEGAAVGAVVVIGIVGTMAAVGPTDSRDTTRSADTTMPTATTPMAPSAITVDTALYQGSCGGSVVGPEVS
jgi:hypothetical protein